MHISAFEARDPGGLMGGSDFLPGGDPVSSVGSRGEGFGEREVGDETTIDSHRDA